MFGVNKAWFKSNSYRILLFMVGAIVLFFSILGLFTLDNHDSSIVAGIIIGCGVVFVAILRPHMTGKYKIGASGIEGELRDLRKATKRAEDTSPPGDENIKPEGAEQTTAEISNKIIEESLESPSTALAHLGVIIERRVRLLLAKTNWLKPSPNLSFSAVIEYLEQRKFLPINLLSSLKIFWDIRNKLIHGSISESDREITSAIDIGLTILKMVDGIPHEINVVYRPGVPVYKDERLKNKYDDILGVILDTTSPGGAIKEKRVFPTRKTYRKGTQLSWEWNFGRVWQAAWYKDPDTGKVKQAWGSSAEFIGRPLEEI